MRIGLVTCAADKLRDYFPTAGEPDFLPTEPPFCPDDQILVNALRQRGHAVVPVLWGTDPGALRLDRLVVRSPWDYMDSAASRQRFLSWLLALDESSLAVHNPAKILLWLLDKHYLADLENAGIPIVPTRFVEAGERFDLTSWMRERRSGQTGARFDLPSRKRERRSGEIVAHASGSDRVIVKPMMSAAGKGLVLVEDPHAFQAEFERLCQDEAYLVQPMLPEIQTHGEWSLIYLDGRYSHGVHKRPAPGKILCQAEQGGSLDFADAPAEVRRVAEVAVARLPAAWSRRHADPIAFPLLYLRVDLIETSAGPLVSECEGVEPELFFRARPGSELLVAEALER